MAVYNRKYCNICSKKFSPRTFLIHQKVCGARKKNTPINVKCLCCLKEHDGNYGSGAYCSKNCMYKDRKRYNKTCPKCQLTISINNYKSHEESCQGPKFNSDIWKVSKNLYACPICKLQFNKMGISSHYIKTHGDLPIPNSYVKSNNASTDRHSQCIVCNGNLSGKQRKYCSNTCKFKNAKISNNNYQAQKRRTIKRKLKFVLDLGGECNRCGYNKNLSSLCFHHINEEEKSFTLDARNISSFGLSTILEEIKKCELLCQNCHGEHHNPDLSLDSIIKEFNWIV